MKKSGLAFLFIVLFSIMVHADKYRRTVSFEWENIEGATGYEVEVTKKIKDQNKLYQLKTKVPNWEGKLSPGTYYIKIRALDYRSVPGEWSSPQELQVNLDNVEVTSFQPGAQIKTDQEEKKELEITWKAVPLAQEYHLLITTQSGEKILDTTTEKTSIETNLSVAQTYTLQISALNSSNQKSDKVTNVPFALLGYKLKKPEFESPTNEFVRELKWQPVSFAESYMYEIQRFDMKSRSWKKITSGETQQAPLDFSTKWPGGKYIIKLKSTAPLREASDFAEMKFKVRSGDRSPASEFNAMVRQSIDRVTKWYALLSYLMTEIQYTSSYYDLGGHTTYNSLGGTLRLGLGYDPEKTNWGFLGILDYGGFLTESSGTLTYLSTEASAVYKKQFRERDEARFYLGVFTRELPATLADGKTGTFTESRIASAGPHLGAEYWYALTPKWGIQTHLHFYANLMKISTPNGANINSSKSYQVGVMASYRSSPRMTYLFGYTRREDKIRYGQGSDLACTTAACRGENNVEVTGNYLNFYVEYDF